MRPVTLKRKSITTIIYLAFVLVVLIVLPAYIHAQALDFTGREDIPYDTRLAEQKENRYGRYECISIVRISAPSGIVYSDSSQWVKGFYYYSITKLGFADIPFNYIVTWDGRTYEGKGGGEEVLLPIDSEKSSLSAKCGIIAYFDNNREITNIGRQSLINATSSMLGKYSLRVSDIEAGKLSLSGNEERSLSKIILNKDLSDVWSGEVKAIASQVTVSTTKREYKASIESVEYNEKVEAGSNFMVNVEIRNDSDFPWYNSGEGQVFIATSSPRNHESDFFVSDKWASFAKVVSMEDEWVLPGDTAKFSFEMGTPLLPGKYKETFELVSIPNNWMKGSQFSVEFSVDGSNLDLVEIKDTETGSLNVRDCASTRCNQIGQVVPGDILIKLGQDGNWYNIQFGDGKEGWVYGKYVKDI